MDGYQKTENLKLNKITGDMIVDIDPIDENFKKIDTAFGDVNATIGNINDTPLDGYNEATDGDKSVANFIKYLWKKLGSIELTDLKVKVTTWANKTLDKVLKELKDKDKEILDTVKEYKASVDEYSDQIGVFVERHKKANDRLESLLTGEDVE